MIHRTIKIRHNKKEEKKYKKRKNKKFNKRKDVKIVLANLDTVGWYDWKKLIDWHAWEKNKKKLKLIKLIKKKLWITSIKWLN